MERQISVYDDYDNPALKQKIWEKTRDDFFSKFKSNNPNAGRSRYKEHIETILSEFIGEFYLDCGSDYDPLLETVSAKTIENFIGKSSDEQPKGSTSNKTLRFLHSYLLIKYPQIEHSLRINDYAIQYAQILEAKFLSWTRTDQKLLKRMKQLSKAVCGIYVNELLEEWPARKPDLDSEKYKAAEQHFGGAFRLLIISSMGTDPILMVHYLSFTEKDIPKLAKGNISNLNLGRASGAMVPVLVNPENKSYVIRFDLFMSNRIENDLPFHFSIIVEKDDYIQDRTNNNIASFTANAFDYAPKCRFVRSNIFEVAGKKLLDLYGVDI